MSSDEQHFSRVDLVQLKMTIAKKLGAQRTEKYLNLLNRFFAHKLTKSDFNKLCIVTIGRENLFLHNRFITAILRNAALSQTPPLKPNKPDPTSVNASAGKVPNGYQRSCLQSLCRDMLPQSPRRGRTPGFHDRKFKDRPSPLGPHGKPQTLPKVLEQQSATELHSLGSRPVEINSVEDGEEVDQASESPGIRSRSPVTAPFGVQIHTKGTRKVLGPPAPDMIRTCYGEGEIPDTSSLRKRLEQKLAAEGLSVSLGCASLLNNGLDAYLKRLIRPCLEMAASRHDFGSLLDFQTAMQLNPTLLGADWQLQLEMISLQQQQQQQMQDA